MGPQKGRYGTESHSLTSHLSGHAGGAHAHVNLAVMMGKRVQIRGCTLRSRPLEEKLAVTRRFATQVVPLLTSNRIQPIIRSCLSFT